MRCSFKKGFVVAGLVAGFQTTFLFTTAAVEAASCCGGGFASPSIITGDERASVSGEFSYSHVATEVSSGGIWQNRNSPEDLESFRLQAAHVFLDRFQAGLNIPVIRRARAGASSSGLGDTSVNVGYEVLPEWDYSPWRPRGVSYLTLTLPTGRGIQDSNDSLQLDARGRGFWAIGLGTTLTRTFGLFDLVSTLEGHRSFTREFRNASAEGELLPGYGAMWMLGGGINFTGPILSNTRLGGSLAFSYEDAIEARGQVTSPGAPVRFATASLVASQMLGDAWALSLAYADQTLFGAPTNTTLARTVTLTAQRRFSR